MLEELKQLEELQKQAEQLQQTDFNLLTPFQLEEIVEKISLLIKEGEEIINQEIKNQKNEKSD